MTEDEFDDRYPLVANHLNPNASWGSGEGPGCLFETYGEELAYVLRQDPRTVWTLVDGDDGGQCLVSGFHFVNRIGYLVSTVAVPEGADIEVRIPMQDDPAPKPDEPVAAMTDPDQRLSEIAREQLGIPTLDMSLVNTMRKALAGEITVRTWWGCNGGLTGDGFRQWFRERLDARINREDRRPWRRLSDDYQASLMRDAIRVRQITQERVIHRQFETDIVNARLGHLLTTEE